MGSGSVRMGGSGGWNTRASWNTHQGRGFGFGMRMNDLELTHYMENIKKKFKDELQDLIHDVMREGADIAKINGISLSNSLKNENYRTISNAIDVKRMFSGKYAGSRLFVEPEPLGPRANQGGSGGVDLAVLYSQQKGPWKYGFTMKAKKKVPVWNTSSFRNASRHAKFPILQKQGKPFQFPGIGGSSPIKRYDFVGIVEKYFDREFETRIKEWMKIALAYTR